jgi:peptidoglycan/LPS O-acetylase OafA/YrhL
MSGPLNALGVAGAGGEGVSLFLVISGFCLSYPALMRRQRGEGRWFVPSVFFARRFLRILPPYYAAVLLCVLLDNLFAGNPRWTAFMTGAPTPHDIWLHLILWHNNVTASAFAINGIFWSLGLEWQWYWVFPIALGAIAVAPHRTIAAVWLLGLCATIWVTSQGDTVSVGAKFLTVRLFEFVCGILVAEVLVQRRQVSPALLWAGFLALLAVFNAMLVFGWAEALHVVSAADVAQPMKGVSFACLLILGSQSARVRRALAWKPLVSLGFISYSVYLVHGPAMALAGIVAPSLALVVTPITGVGFGAVFFSAVERPCLSERARRAVHPRLERVLGWTDAVYAGWRLAALAAFPRRSQPMSRAAEAD